MQDTITKLQNELATANNQCKSLTKENSKLLDLVDNYKSELLMYGHEFDEDGVVKSPPADDEVSHK